MYWSSDVVASDLLLCSGPSVFPMSVPGSDQPMKKSTKKAAPKRKSVMKGGKIDKAMLPSRHVTEGPERAPHRSFYYAMGLTEKEIHQPFVGEIGRESCRERE